MTEEKVYTEGVFKLTTRGELVCLKSSHDKTVYLYLTSEQVSDLRNVLGKYLVEASDD